MHSQMMMMMAERKKKKKTLGFHMLSHFLIFFLDEKLQKDKAGKGWEYSPNHMYHLLSQILSKIFKEKPKLKTGKAIWFWRAFSGYWSLSVLHCSFLLSVEQKSWISGTTSNWVLLCSREIWTAMKLRLLAKILAFLIASAFERKSILFLSRYTVYFIAVPSFRIHGCPEFSKEENC